jgi:hypothetical protein
MKNEEIQQKTGATAENSAAKNDNLLAWLTDPRTAEYFGTTFTVKADVLAHLLTGDGTLADIGRRRGISRQAVHKHAVKARKIYFTPST